MKTLLSVLGSLIVAAIVFVTVSHVWFNSVPLSWIYSIRDIVSKLQGDEGTLDTMLLTSMLVGGISAVAVFIGVFKFSSRQ